jgi:Uncharacterized low-complexity proteins
MLNSNSIELRKVEQKDVQAIRDLMCVVYKDELKRCFIGNEDELYIPGYDSVEMQQYHTWDNKYFKIMHEDKMIGVILVSTTGREHGRIDRFYILPEYQGNGIGSKSLSLVETLFAEVKIWTLDTTKFSPRNHHFYEKNGYQLGSEDESERYYYKTIGEIDSEKEDYHTGLDYSMHNFRDSNFANTDWYDLNMWHSTFSDSNLSNTVFQNVNLNKARFTNVNLSNVIMGDSNMSNAELCHSIISNFHIHDINLNNDEDTSFTLERCKIENSSICESNLKNLKIDNCNLEGATIDGISIEELMRCYKKIHM